MSYPSFLGGFSRQVGRVVSAGVMIASHCRMMTARRAWTRDHRPAGATEWVTYWPNGKVRTRSAWLDLRAEGPATLCDPDGKEQMRVEFERGRVKTIRGEPGEF